MAFTLAGIENEYRFELRTGTTMVVGRAVNSDCPVVDATVSRRHAEMVVKADSIHVTDFGSSNGSYLNGTKIDTAVAKSGDTVTFGSVRFMVEFQADVAPPPRPAADPNAPAGATVVRPITAGSTALFSATGAGGDIKAAIKAANTGADKNQQKLAILLEIAKGLTSAADVDALLSKVATYAFEIFEADRCAILLLDDNGQLQPKISRDKRGEDAPAVVPMSIARLCTEEKSAVLSDDAGADDRFKGGASILMQKVRGAMCVPLVGSEDKVLGVLYVDNFISTHRFTEEDLDFLIAFASIASAATENGQFADKIRQQAQVRGNFERFFTPQLAARIANSADAIKLGGEKRPVAVLFSDIRGFTALSETMNPDAMAKLLTEYFTEMVDCVFQHGGTLDKFIGDAVMAQWGAPLGEPDDGDRAMSAALDMMSALDKLNERWTSEGRPTVQIGIGLNFGEAFAGNIGSERRLEYTVIGDTVNTASRLCSVAKKGEIIISEDFLKTLKNPPQLQPLEPVPLKGKTQPVPIFLVKR
jgi:adenylate cyclase